MWVSQEHIGPLILKKYKYISSPEQNYFSHYAMRYPVVLLDTGSFIYEIYWNEWIFRKLVDEPQMPTILKKLIGSIIKKKKNDNPSNPQSHIESFVSIWDTLYNELVLTGSLINFVGDWRIDQFVIPYLFKLEKRTNHYCVFCTWSQKSCECHD